VGPMARHNLQDGKCNILRAVKGLKRRSQYLICYICVITRKLVEEKEIRSKICPYVTSTYNQCWLRRLRDDAMLTYAI